MAIQDLTACKGDVLLALGGSCVTTRRNATSDTDVFAIGPDGHLPIVRRLIASMERTDLEFQSIDWLEEITSKLSGYSPAISGGAIDFSFWDLRFLARVSLGKVLIHNPTIWRMIDAVREEVRLALANFMSTLFVNLYEDAVGLFLSERYEDVLLISGELCQRACLLSLLQTGLYDPAPKWSFAMARECPHNRLSTRAGELHRHLSTYSKGDRRGWVVELLNGTNRLIAEGIIESFDGSDADTSIQSNEHLVEQLKDPVCCLMGIPGYLTLLNAKTSRIALCNRHFVYAITQV